MGLRVSDSRNALYLKAARGQQHSSTTDNSYLCLMAFDKGLNILRQPHDRQERLSSEQPITNSTLPLPHPCQPHGDMGTKYVVDGTAEEVLQRTETPKAALGPESSAARNKALEGKEMNCSQQAIPTSHTQRGAWLTANQRSRLGRKRRKRRKGRVGVATHQIDRGRGCGNRHVGTTGAHVEDPGKHVNGEEGPSSGILPAQ
jgi:hypothetical protein